MAQRPRVFIAGGSGFPGRQLARAWVGLGAHVLVSTRAASCASQDPQIEFVQWRPATEAAPPAIAACDVAPRCPSENDEPPVVTIGGGSRRAREGRRSSRMLGPIAIGDAPARSAK
jgi:NAD(P)-dependent dehydrogenase (short-subunit alcohol dehydrogenase family)